MERMERDLRLPAPVCMPTLPDFKGRLTVKPAQCAALEAGREAPKDKGKFQKGDHPFFLLLLTLDRSGGGVFAAVTRHQHPSTHTQTRTHTQHDTQQHTDTH